MKILILGVGNAQVDPIIYLKDKGHYVYGCSYRDEGPGKELVDQFELIDITDKDAVKKYVYENKIDCLYSVGSDIAMATIGYVSEELGLPFFVKENTAELLQEKSRFREFQKVHDISPIPFRAGTNIEDFTSWNYFPSILKPVDSQGQRGIFEIENEGQFKTFLPKSLSCSRKNTAIIEKYINGPEISVNSYMYKGESRYNFISTREVVENLPGGIVKGHEIPAQLDNAIKENVLGLVAKTIHKLDIQNGPVYCQIKYENYKPYIIEFTPRLDGCHLWKLIKFTYGIDLLDLSFNHLFGNYSLMDFIPVSIPELPHKLDFFLERPGKKFIPYNFKLKSDSLFYKFYYNNNETIRPINGLLEKVGYQITAG